MTGFTFLILNTLLSIFFSFSFYPFPFQISKSNHLVTICDIWHGQQKLKLQWKPWKMSSKLHWNFESRSMRTLEIDFIHSTSEPKTVNWKSPITQGHFFLLPHTDCAMDRQYNYTWMSPFSFSGNNYLAFSSQHPILRDVNLKMPMNRTKCRTTWEWNWKM